MVVGSIGVIVSLAAGAEALACSATRYLGQGAPAAGGWVDGAIGGGGILEEGPAGGKRIGGGSGLGVKEEGEGEQSEDEGDEGDDFHWGSLGCIRGGVSRGVMDLWILMMGRAGRV